MIKVEYEGRSYSYTDSGWVNEKNVIVPATLQFFLRKKAVEQGEEPSQFKLVEVSKPKPKPKETKRKPKKISIKIFDD